MLNQSDKKVLYGRDLYYAGEANIKINNINFVGYEDCKTISIEDFHYKTFKLKGESGDFFLYNDIVYDNCVCYPICSYFFDDYSELDYISQDVTIESAHYTYRKKNKIKSYSFSFANDKKIDTLSTKNISKHFDLPARNKYSDYVNNVKVSIQDNMYFLNVASDCCDFIFEHLKNFFGVENILVMNHLTENTPTPEKIYYSKVHNVYFLSVLRACIIALQACMKYQCDIVFEFRPFYFLPSISIDSKIAIDSGNNIANQIDVSLHGIINEVFVKDMIFNIFMAFAPFLNNYKTIININLVYGYETYITEPGILIYNELLSKSFFIANIINREVGGTMLENNIEKLNTNFYDGYVEKNELYENVVNLIKESRFREKSILYNSSNKTTEIISTARRLSRRINGLLAFSKVGILDNNKVLLFNQVFRKGNKNKLFSVNGYSFFVVEYNQYYKEIINLYMVISINKNLDGEKEKIKIFATLMNSLQKYRINFDKNFNEKIVLKIVKTENEFTSRDVLDSFVLYLLDLMNNEN